MSFGASSTSSPPSVQRKSKRFTHQLVVAVLTGTGDAAIETIAQDLQRKHPDISSLIHVHLRKGNIFEPATHDLMAISPSDKLAIQNAKKAENQTENAATVEKCFVINTKKAPCRLYLVAHGDDGFNFAGLPGAHMAVFVRNTLRISQVTCISVVSCYGAGYIPPLYNASESQEVNEQRIDAARRAPMDTRSFAAVFHRELKEKGLRTEVLARRANVNTDSKTLGKGTRFDPSFNRFDATGHKAPWSKFRFYWDGETQKVAPVYSDGDTSAWPQDLT
ncbi:C80 family cysteine peptidase [Corallococcus sp. EGB]|uniref:C80 family cysteine peptidase n=1 Tax=Corallococcus sp. EGB TaxID=1521117 RepID=UPI001CBD545C|nr:C80 family cysteine peptidase [Corallococcus sp. EGB]